MTCRSSLRPFASLLIAAPFLVAAAACGGRQAADPSPTGFRLGTYDNCVTDTILSVPGGGGEVGVAGSVTLSQSGSTFTVSYGGDSGVFTVPSLQFTQASDTSATLLAGQDVSGVSVPCAPLDFAPTVTQLVSGSLTYNAGTLFLSVEGAALPVDAGGGCSNPGGQATILIACSDDAADAGAPPPAADAAVASSEAMGSDFVGVYTCSSATVNSKLAPPQGYESTSSDTDSTTAGTLTMTQAGGVLTAAYANDLFVQGSMQFVAATPTAAFPAVANQTMQVECNNPYDSETNTPMSPLPVTSSTLTLDGSYLVLSLFGDMTSTSTCPGAETFVSVLCSK
jgi:hypothetical protein